ncbi:hypothetical protein PGT21_022913 [Puccinia graminis f. sp. tritici]|uniref:Uncharacterized protein n=1 Tax=Puccinia graminis f. sp. tritici TaxID=56615 RepID=A0A5B0PE25_PUCGR|nr:hypothetical protein PGT21_022913 [Puccinia graminis f. sp. tritici]
MYGGESLASQVDAAQSHVGLRVIRHETALHLPGWLIFSIYRLGQSSTFKANRCGEVSWAQYHVGLRLIRHEAAPHLLDLMIEAQSDG